MYVFELGSERVKRPTGRAYLDSTPPVFYPHEANSVHAVQHPVGSHPLVEVLPALSRYARDLHRASQVHLQPLVVVVVARAPSAHEAAAFR